MATASGYGSSMSFLSKSKRYAWASLIIAIALYIASGAVFATDAPSRSVVDPIEAGACFQFLHARGW